MNKQYTSERIDIPEVVFGYRGGHVLFIFSEHKKVLGIVVGLGTHVWLKRWADLCKTLEKNQFRFYCDMLTSNNQGLRKTQATGVELWEHCMFLN